MSDFEPVVSEFPMTLNQYEEQSKLLSDPEYIGSLTMQDLQQIKHDRDRFAVEREAKRERMLNQGLKEEDLQLLEDAERKSSIDPNEQSTKASIKQEVERDVAGLVEGGKQAVEGVFDLAMDISVATGLDDEQSRQAWKEGVRQRRVTSRQEHMATFGQLPGNAPELVGNMIPWLAASTSQAAGYTMFLARNAFLGGVSAAAQMQPDGGELNDRWLDVAFGTTFGAGIGGVMGLPSFLRRSGARGLVKAFNESDPQQRELTEALAREMTENPDFTFSAAQLTGTRFYQNLELAAADTATKGQQNQNLDILYNHIMKTAKELAANGVGAGRIAGSMKETLKTARDTIYRTATNNWGNASRQIVERYGDEVLIDGGAYLQKVDDIVAQEVNALENMGAKPSEALLKYRDAVDQLVNPVKVVEEGQKTFIVDATNPALKRRILGATPEIRRKLAEEAAVNANASRGPNAQESLQLITGLNRLIGGDTAVFENVTANSNRNIGRALMGALTGEMGSAPQNEAAVGAIQLLRQGYRQDMAAAQAIDESVFAAIFGAKKLPRNPGKALDQLMRSEAADLRQTRQFLEEWNPQLLADIQRTALKRAALRSNAAPSAAHVDGAVDLGKLANNLSDGFKREGMFGSGLFSPETQKDILLTAQSLRILNNKSFKGVVPGGTRPEEWTINLISRSPEFAGRFVTRLFASGQTLETALLNPEWRHALRTIAGENLDSKKGRAAILYLSNWWADRESVRKMEEQRKDDIQKASFDPTRASAGQQ